MILIHIVLYLLEELERLKYLSMLFRKSGGCFYILINCWTGAAKSEKQVGRNVGRGKGVLNAREKLTNRKPILQKSIHWKFITRARQSIHFVQIRNAQVQTHSHTHKHRNSLFDVTKRLMVHTNWLKFCFVCNQSRMWSFFTFYRLSDTERNNNETETKHFLSWASLFFKI